MSKIKKLHSDFCKEVYDLVQEEYAILSLYEGSKKKILIKHNACNNEYYARPDLFLSGKRCPFCANKKRGNELQKNKSKNNQKIKYLKTNKNDNNSISKSEKFIIKINNMYNNEYIVIGEYIDCKTKILIEHRECGKQFMIRPTDLQQNKISHKCEDINKKKRVYISKATIKKRRNDTEFKNEISKITNNEYTVLDEFINTKTKIRFQHNVSECGEIFEMAPNTFLKGTRCPICSINLRKKTHEQFCKEIYELVENEYTVLGEYINVESPILMRHNVCNHEYKIKPIYFTSGGSRCPKCGESKGERRIRYFLEHNHIEFSSQYTFDDLRCIELLRFDFATFYKGKLECLIEFDGEQHYKWFKTWMTEESFLNQQKRDKLKNEYCLNNNIKLIRIPYSKYDNIDKILNKELKNINNKLNIAN